MKNWLKDLPLTGLLTYTFKTGANNILTVLRATDPFIRAGIVPRVIGENVENTIRVSKASFLEKDPSDPKAPTTLWADIIVAPSMLQLFKKMDTVSLAGEITTILSTAGVQAKQVHHSFLTDELVALYSGCTGWILMQASGYESKTNVPTPLSKIMAMGGVFSNAANLIRESHKVGNYVMGSENLSESTITRIAINDGESQEDILSILNWTVNYLSGVDLGFNEDIDHHVTNPSTAAKISKAAKMAKRKTSELETGGVPSWMCHLSHIELLLAFQNPEGLPTLISSIGGSLDLKAYEDYLPIAQQKYYRDAIAGNLVLMYYKLLPGLLAIRECCDFLDNPIVKEYLKDQAWYNTQAESLTSLVSWGKSLKLGKLFGNMANMNKFDKAKMGEASSIDLFSIHRSLFMRYMKSKSDLISLTDPQGLMNTLIGLNRLLTDGFLTKDIITAIDNSLSSESISKVGNFAVNFDEMDVVQVQGLRTNMGVSSLKDLYSKAFICGSSLRMDPGVMVAKTFTPGSDVVVRERYPFVRHVYAENNSPNDIQENLNKNGLPDATSPFFIVVKSVIDDNYVVDIANRPSIKFAPATKIGYPTQEDSLQKVDDIFELIAMMGYTYNSMSDVLKIPFIGRFLTTKTSNPDEVELVSNMVIIGKTPVDLVLGELVNTRSVYECTQLFLLDKRLYRVLQDKAPSAVQYITGMSVTDYMFLDHKFIINPMDEMKASLDLKQGMFPTTI